MYSQIGFSCRNTSNTSLQLHPFAHPQFFLYVQMLIALIRAGAVFLPTAPKLLLSSGQSSKKQWSQPAETLQYIPGLYVARQCRVLISVWRSMQPPGSRGR